jgi:PhnB protein
MTTINPWINFNGNAEEAFTFYKSVFGGEFTKVTRFKDMAGSGMETGVDAEKIMQIVLTVGDGQMLIGNDVPSFMGTVSEQENRSKIHVSLDTREEAEKIFGGLSAGGQVEAQPENGGEAYFAMFRDKYGIEWVIECN